MEEKEEIDEAMIEARKKLLRLSEITSFARQTLRASFGLNPLSVRERILLRFENLKNQENPQGETRFRPLVQRRPILERLESLKDRFQPESEEDRLVQKYLKEREKEKILKQIEEERKKREEEERKKKEHEQLERAKRNMGVVW